MVGSSHRTAGEEAVDSHEGAGHIHAVVEHIHAEVEHSPEEGHKDWEGRSLPVVAAGSRAGGVQFHTHRVEHTLQ